MYFGISIPPFADFSDPRALAETAYARSKGATRSRQTSGGNCWAMFKDIGKALPPSTRFISALHRGITLTRLSRSLNPMQRPA